MLDQRADVLAIIAARPAVPAARPPALLSVHSVRPLSAELAALTLARERAVLRPTGTEYPRRESWQLTIVPAFAIGFVAAVVAVVAAAISHGGLGLIALVVLAACLLVVIVGGRWLLADPLRLNRARRLEVMAGGRWESRQAWVAPFAAGPERALVDVAVKAALQIANSPAWLPPNYPPDKPPMALDVELDQIDAQARQIAAVRATTPADPGVARQWETLIDRVVALRTYAAELTAAQAAAPLGFEGPA